MKLYVAAAFVALARQASAFKVVIDSDGDYCVEVVKYTTAGPGHTVDGSSGSITGAPANVKLNGNTDPTVAQNGINDPTGEILAAANTLWSSFVGGTDSAITVYLPGTTTAYTGDTSDASGTLSFCGLYSTFAPEHYCKGDGAFASWQKSTIKSTIQECCTTNHASMYEDCVQISSGIVPPGSGDWYGKYEDSKCVRDCNTANLFDPDSTNDKDLHSFAATTSYECGGFPSWSGVTEYTTAVECCENTFTSIVKEYCEWLSTTGSSASPGTYAGRAVAPNADKFWYADTSNGICVQDCVKDSTVTCGGVITAASTPVYETVSSCCSAAMAWDKDGCETRSPVGAGEPTNSFWASSEGCRQDCTGSDNCSSAPSTAKLYSTAAECCSTANAWVNSEFCETRAVAGWNTDTGTATLKWYVSYEDGACRQDCTDDSPQCKVAESGSLTFFTSAESCCKASLSYLDEEACEAASETGQTINTVSTDEWYVVPGSDQLCAQDCETSTTNKSCGGIVSKSGVRLYDTETECCKQAYSWTNEALCIALSRNFDEPTDLWYVDYSANVCKQDCTTAGTGACVQPSGRPDDKSITMFDTAENCCKTKLGWLDSDQCKTSSETGVDPTDADSPGTGKWRKNDSWNSCVIDCTEGDAIGATDGILTVQPLNDALFRTKIILEENDNYPTQCDGISTDSTGAQYTDLSSCCDSINWVQKEVCTSFATGEYSQKYFLDPSDATKCVYHEDTALCTGADSTIPDPSPSPSPTPSPFASNAIAGLSCNKDITVSTKLWDTLDKCCEKHVNWDKDHCVTSSKNDVATGSNKYYVDWVLSKCVKDCPEAAGTSCGGIANRWNTMYDDENSCCNKLNWIARKDCVYTS